MIGNAFRLSYALQVRQQHPSPVKASRSVESLLGGGTDDGLYANLDDIRDVQASLDPFARLAKERRSDNTFDRRAATQMRMVRMENRYL